MTKSKKSFGKELFIFFTLTILITWILWLPSILSSEGIDVPVVFLILSMMASFTPSILGLYLQRKYLGECAFKNDIKSRFSFDFDKKWLVIIPLFFFVTAGLSYIIMNVLVEDFEVVNSVPLLLTPLVFLQILVIGGALGEEFGWRGFAQPRIQILMNPIPATLLLGLVWSFWHLPLFFIDGTVQSNMPIWQFVLQNTLIAFYYTWLYNKSNGSIILMIYLHAIANTSAAVIPYWQNDIGRWIGFIVLLVFCLLLYIFKPLDKQNVVENFSVK